MTVVVVRTSNVSVSVKRPNEHFFTYEFLRINIYLYCFCFVYIYAHQLWNLHSPFSWMFKCWFAEIAVVVALVSAPFSAPLDVTVWCGNLPYIGFNNAKISKFEEVKQENSKIKHDDEIGNEIKWKFRQSSLNGIKAQKWSACFALKLGKHLLCYYFCGLII